MKFTSPFPTAVVMNNFHSQKAFFGLSLAAVAFASSAVLHKIDAAPAPVPLRQQFSSSQLPAIAATTPTLPAAEESGELVDQGKHRTYYLHTPLSYQADHPMPLVIALHGSGDQGKNMAEQTALSKLADQKGFIVVYPDGLNKKWNVSRRAPENNVTFVHALIAHLKQVRAIDAKRIYAAGLSNGGILVQELACEDPSEIAAVATVAASLPTTFQGKCQNHTPVSLMMINGTKDEVVRWEGGDLLTAQAGHPLSIQSVPEVIDFWRHHDACAETAQVENRSDNRVEISNYQNCAAGAEVTLVALNGAGHEWTGGGYGQSDFLDATATVWNFFERHQLSL